MKHGIKQTTAKATRRLETVKHLKFHVYAGTDKQQKFDFHPILITFKLKCLKNICHYMENTH